LVGKAVSLRPVDFTADLRSLLASKVQPPKLSPTEIHLLDFHTDGILAVGEAFRVADLLGYEYQFMSRVASHETIKNMVEHPDVIASGKLYRAYLEAKMTKPQRVRKYCDDVVRGASIGYKPFVSGLVHVWLWDDKDQRILYSCLANSCMRHSMFYGFVANTLSDLTELGAVCDDLKAEYDQVLRHLGLINSTLKYLTENLSK
jgi:hypothetical protein